MGLRTKVTASDRARSRVVNTTRALLTLGVAALLGLSQPAYAKKKAVPGQLTVEQIAVMFSSDDEAQVRAAIEGAALLGSPAVVPIVTARVEAGLPPLLLQSALEALMLLGDPGAIPLFERLASHRTAAVRINAIEGLTMLGDAAVGKTMQQALSDADPRVREAAARGLGELGAKDARPTLFKAFDKDVWAAATALGKLCDASDLGRILGYLGRVPFTAISPLFDAMMARRDVTPESKLQVVAQLTELGTAEARGYLEHLTKDLPPDTHGRVRRAIEDAIVRIAQ